MATVLSYMELWYTRIIEDGGHVLSDPVIKQLSP